MEKLVVLFIFSVILNKAISETRDSITSSPAPVIIQKPNSSNSNSKWDELMPALQTIKNSSNIKKERLLNVVKIIKYLLSDELEKNQTECTDSKVLEIKEPECESDLPVPEMLDIDGIVEERLKSIKEKIDDRSYMLDKVEIKNETIPVKNKTADLGRILTKITNALAKLKERDISSETQMPSMVPIFRPQYNYPNDFDASLFEDQRQLRSPASSLAGMNPMSSMSMFNIPCQRASDILEETATYPLPKEAFCDNPAVNLKALAMNTNVNLDNLPFKNIVPNSISCVDSEDSVAILFKPKTISFMQVYGNLLKKITLTVLVPFYVSKLLL